MASRSEFFSRLIENWPAKIIALAVALVIVLLNDLSEIDERYFTVPLTLELSDTLVPGAEYTSRVQVQLRGPEDRIFDVLEDDVLAVADLSAHTADGVFRAPIEVRRDGAAADLDGLEITVDPPQVTVTLEERLSRSVEVVPNLTGFPPSGYELSDYRISPTAIDVVGPRSRVEPITQILTEAISLTGRNGDFTESVRLSRPDSLVSFPGGDLVDFRGLIVETIVQTNFSDLEITIVDLDPSLAVISAVQTGTIRAQGRQIDVEGVPTERIGLFVDASNVRQPGTYALPVRPQIPGGIIVLEIDPARIELVIAEATARVEEDQ